MICSYMDTVLVVKKNDNPVSDRAVKFRKPPVNKVGRRVCRFQIGKASVKRLSSEPAVLALCRNSAFANFSKVFVLKRQLYGHRIR